MNNENEGPLRAHVRELLFEYARTHLTVDHVEFVQAAVSDLLSDILKPLPTHEPGLLVLPIDPLEMLEERLKHAAPVPYNEVWETDPDTVQFLRKTLAFQTGATRRTQLVWDEDDLVDLTNMSYRLMSPVLSRSSKRKTPELGRKPSENKSMSSMLSAYAIKCVPDEMLEDNRISLEDFMDIRLTINVETRSGLVACRDSTPFLARTKSSYPLPKHVAAFLSESTIYEEKFRMSTPPLFTRDRRANKQTNEANTYLAGHVSITELMQPVSVEKIGPDVADANMVVLNGWTTFAPSASSSQGSPSLSPGERDLDELDDDLHMWRPSSSVGVPAFVETWDKVRMDEPLFPRADRPRTGKTDEVTKVKESNLSSFMSEHLPAHVFRIVTTPKSDDNASRARMRPLSPPASLVSLSMLGQPPSEAEIASGPSSESGSKSELDEDVRRVLKWHGELTCNSTTKFQDVLMQEPLDEKEGMFMNVPLLPPPNAYLRTTVDGEQMIRNSANTRTQTNSYISLLPPVNSKKVTGLKSLNLELSWRPFSFGTKVPTHAELARAHSPPSFSNLEGLGFGDEPAETRAVEDLLTNSEFTPNTADFFQSVLSGPESHCSDLRFFKDLDADMKNDFLVSKSDLGRTFDDDQLFILTRAERHALSCQHHLNTNARDMTPAANELYSSNGSSDVFSVITPDFDPLLSAPQIARYTNFLSEENARIDVFNYTEEGARISYTIDEGTEDLDVVRDWKKRRVLDDASHTEGVTTRSVPAVWEAFDKGIEDYLAETGSDTLTIDPRDLVLNYQIHAPQTRQIFPVDSQAGLSRLEEFSVQSQSRFLTDRIDMSHGPDADDYNAEINKDMHKEALGYERMQGLMEEDSVSSHMRPVTPTNDQVSNDNRRPDPQDLQAVTAGTETGIISSRRNYSPKKLLSASVPSFLCDRNSLNSFLQLRGKKIATSKSGPSDTIDHPEQTCPNDVLPLLNEQPAPQFDESARMNLFSETRAFVLPENWTLPTSEHTYLASLDFFQQRALVCFLESPLCAVRLVERENLTPPCAVSAPVSGVGAQHTADVSLIVGPHSAVVFFPLVALPSQAAYTTLLNALATYSWRFAHVLLVLVAFPRSKLFRASNLNSDPNPQNKNADGPCSYSPPALKAVKRIRRDLALQEGTGEKNPACVTELAFADGVEEAATLVRAFGDVTLQGSMVDYTPYIGEDEQEGECDLAQIEGMNAFCATVILQCCALNEFLEMPPKRRTSGFAELIGRGRIEHVNAILSARMQIMSLDLPGSSDPLSLSE
ncbi:hypothetical protein M0805_009239 [Coniferiporia weirii]|nr:hypothetical protein M0805_009239 [Coniferiporia weirii]